MVRMIHQEHKLTVEPVALHINVEEKAGIASRCSYRRIK
jgi:hypothetical protein